jgi:hypothetical protein
MILNRKFHIALATLRALKLYRVLTPRSVTELQQRFVHECKAVSLRGVTTIVKAASD